MVSSKQLSRTLKLKIVDTHKGGEGYKKIAKRFLMPLSSVRNVVKKFQSSGTVGVKARSGRPRIIFRQIIELFGRKEQRYIWRRKGTEFN